MRCPLWEGNLNNPSILAMIHVYFCCMVHIDIPSQRIMLVISLETPIEGISRKSDSLDYYLSHPTDQINSLFLGQSSQYTVTLILEAW
jgi:hypothetical protein